MHEKVKPLVVLWEGIAVFPIRAVFVPCEQIVSDKDDVMAAAEALVEAFEPRDGAGGLLAGQWESARLAATDCPAGA